VTSILFTWRAIECAGVSLFGSSRFPTLQEGWRNYSGYSIDTDPEQDDKATEIKLCSFARPHMRAFHCSWWSFFIAFFIWFAIAPLLSEIRDTLGITKEDVWTSSIVGVGGTIITRFILGPMCDKYGARILFTLVLCVASIPTACTGFARGQPIRFGQGETMEEVRANQSSFTLFCWSPSQGILRKTRKLENRRTFHARTWKWSVHGIF
jgi:hypothetical protein